MLPEKKRRLLIGIIGVLLFILVILGIWRLSSYIKDKNKKTERDSSPYAEFYDYFGVLKDKEGIYRIYGIKDGEEVYLGLKTFYNVQDVIVKDEKVIIYSDAVNEIRYDSETEEYYFYELDTYYNNKDDVKLGLDYIVTMKNKTLSFWKFGDDKKENISNVDAYAVNNNKLYYLSNSKILEYDLENKKETKLVEDTENELTLLGASNDYLFYKLGSIIHVYKFDNKFDYNLSELVGGEYVCTTDIGLLLKENNKIINYDLEKNLPVFRYYIEDEVDVEYILKLENTIYYFNFPEKYDIIDIDNEKVVYSLENSYLYLTRVM